MIRNLLLVDLQSSQNSWQWTHDERQEDKVHRIKAIFIVFQNNKYFFFYP